MNKPNLGIISEKIIEEIDKTSQEYQILVLIKKGMKRRTKFDKPTSKKQKLKFINDLSKINDDIDEITKTAKWYSLNSIDKFTPTLKVPSDFIKRYFDLIAAIKRNRSGNGVSNDFPVDEHTRLMATRLIKEYRMSWPEPAKSEEQWFMEQSITFIKECKSIIRELYKTRFLDKPKGKRQLVWDYLFSNFPYPEPMAEHWLKETAAILLGSPFGNTWNKSLKGWQIRFHNRRFQIVMDDLLGEWGSREMALREIEEGLANAQSQD